MSALQTVQARKKSLSGRKRQNQTAAHSLRSVSAPLALSLPVTSFTRRQMNLLPPPPPSAPFPAPPHHCRHGFSAPHPSCESAKTSLRLFVGGAVEYATSPVLARDPAGRQIDPKDRWPPPSPPPLPLLRTNYSRSGWIGYRAAPPASDATTRARQKG